MFTDIMSKEEAEDMIDEILNAERITLSDWEQQFLENVYNSPVKYLTLKQTAKLKDIYFRKLG